MYFQPKENFLQFYRRIMWLIFDVTFWCDLASGHSGSRLWYFNRVRGLWSHCRTCSSMWLWYTAQYICPSNLVQYICSSMCYNTLHNTSVLCSSTLHALGPGLEGGLPKQLPAKPSSDNHRVEGKYELLLRLSSLMLDPPLKYQFVPIAPYTGCAQWPSSPQVRFLLTVELCPFQHRSWTLELTFTQSSSMQT